MRINFLRQYGWRVAKWTLGVFLILLLLAIVAFEVIQPLNIALPPKTPVKLATLKQGWESGWDVGESEWFHHADQGTKIIRYDWFLALEQPEVSIRARFKAGKFSDPEYLQRFGFIPSHPDASMNPDGLPVGFAVNREFREPQSGAPDPYPVVGLTCAACHTGQINYKGNGLRIDGGSGMVDLGKFKAALGRAVAFTRYVPGRFDRFADGVLKDKNTAGAKEKLRQELYAFIDKGKLEKEFAETKGLYAREGGFSRTDALGLILNRVFEQVDKENLGVADAPVNFPHIWDAPWFDWVQYNASIRTPMARNIGEVLGVGGMVSLPGVNDTDEDDWNSTVNIRNLHEMEKQLAGPEPFKGLASPKWPAELLGDLDEKLTAKGAVLYRELNCHNCHWLVEDLQAAYTHPEGQGGPNLIRMWTAENVFGKRFINTARIVPGALPVNNFSNVERIGTDPGAALNFARRLVITASRGELKVAGSQLDNVTNRIRAREYQKLGFLNDGFETVPAMKDQKLEFDGYRVPWDEYVAESVEKGSLADRALGDIKAEIENQQDSAIRLGYKSRPLNGIWATAPYLHNGSVRSLYQLLLPAAEREKTFYLGTKEYDPKEVGYENTKLPGGFKLDTSLSGNHNTGHEFRDTSPADGKRMKGVLGRALSHGERLALIEFLKSL